VIRAVLLLLALAITPAAACEVTRRAMVPLTVMDGLFVATAEIDHMPVRLVLDTGAEQSLLTEAAVRRLGLALDPWVGSTMRGIGGIERHQDAVASLVVLGGEALRQSAFLPRASFAVGGLAPGLAGVDGLLGRDFLSHFDLDLDGPRRDLALFEVRACAGRFLPWHVPYSAIATLPGYGAALAVTVHIDGHSMRALPDTGADVSLLIAPGMSRLGLDLAAVAGDRRGVAGGVGEYRTVVRRHGFDAMQVGDETIEHPSLLVAPLRLHFDMLLGADWFLPRRVWLSFATRQVFVVRPQG
jgi:predicted aspartyl protease